MASHAEQIQLTTELKTLTNQWCAKGMAIVDALRDQDKAQLHILREQQDELKREMDLIRDKLLKEDNMGVTKV